MANVLLILALLLQLSGFAFLFTASLGVLRFKDPLQRMHAATKAGTIGAGLTVAGVALASRDAYTMGIAALAVLFLVFSIPVAGHLLGRAIYFSGASSLGKHSRDDLKKKPNP
ncbi:monovalent cation/H(+) antiporter subunit G [Pusillimonas sp.]|uniref:monovalent cation/H(+) antiporter subunit G n=1 Tax=Pusillimonas sp. TaxID=3040095 RepID=UPI0037CC7440